MTKKISKCLFFWDPCISPHKYELLFQIEKKFKNIKTFLIAPIGLPDDKNKFLKKYNENSSKIKILVTNEKQKIIEIIQAQNPQDINIISGYWGNLNSKLIIKVLKGINKNFSYISETRFHYRFSDFLKFLQSLIFENEIRRNSNKVFCIGDNAYKWFLTTRYPKQKLINFSYYVDIDANLDYLNTLNSKNKTLNIGYIGDIIMEKGLNSYIKALKNLDLNYLFLICGDGVDKEYFIDLCIAENIKFQYVGMIDYHERNKFYELIDVLILNPYKKSKRNGWCTVVNESLLCGKPVICNKYVGASSLIDNENKGFVTNDDSYLSLYNSLNKLYNNLSFYRENIYSLSSLAHKEFSVDKGAEKLISSISK